MTLRNRLLYVYSCDLDVNVQIKIGALEGQMPLLNVQQIISENSDNDMSDCATLTHLYNAQPTTSDAHTIFASVEVVFAYCVLHSINSPPILGVQ
jgi:hypothetical protein